ncbi:ATP-binding protein [Candidatus Margulisiibacteriota bacterium]
MQYKIRLLEKTINHHLKRGKSILLLGPRQTGKSTLVQKYKFDLSLSFLLPAIRLRYEKNPDLLAGEIDALRGKKKKQILVCLDEVQKVPAIMDVVQYLIDNKTAQFVLTGSSARKLKRGSNLNLLPGRLVSLRLDPFVYNEYSVLTIEQMLLYGNLPGIVQEKKRTDREIDLASYVEAYLEEEIRSEALVRNIGSFARFLEYAGLESGKIVNYRALSQEIGVSHTTIMAYFEILKDCLIAEFIEPLCKSKTRKKLTKTNRFLLFDLGVRRLCAKEADRLQPQRMGELFEQYVGLELIRYARLTDAGTKIRFWRDPDGPEVDWVIEKNNSYIPIEVKWNTTPRNKDIKHLKVFLEEYPQASIGYLICRTPRKVKLEKNIFAIPWKELHNLFDWPESGHHTKSKEKRKT